MHLLKTIKPVFTFLLPFTLLVFLGCDSDDDLPSQPNNAPANLVDAIDLKYFNQLKTLSDLYAQNEIWKNYKFVDFSHYLIRQEAGQPPKGFVINPTSVTSAMTKIDESSTNGLNVYRFEDQIENAIQQLNQGNGLFDFNYKIDGNNYYLQLYNTNEVESSEAIALNVHENFHQFQFGWHEKPTAFQDFDNFPVNQDLLQLQLLAVEILRGIEQITDDTIIRELLGQYVALRTEEIRLDPTSNQLITNHSNYQEMIEGTAKYIEVTALSTSGLFPNTSFEFVNTSILDREGLNTREKVRELVGQLVFYDTGSAVIYMLKKLGIEIEKLENNLYPYDLAVDFLKLSDQQMADALAKAKTHTKWDQIQTKATDWSKLQ